MIEKKPKKIAQDKYYQFLAHISDFGIYAAAKMLNIKKYNRSVIIINSVVLIGRIVRDPELKFIPSTGMGVTKMTLAVDKDLYGDKKQQAISQGKPTADFINVTVFGKMAESCANYLAKR